MEDFMEIFSKDAKKFAENCSESSKTVSDEPENRTGEEEADENVDEISFEECYCAPEKLTLQTKPRRFRDPSLPKCKCAYRGKKKSETVPPIFSNDCTCDSHCLKKFQVDIPVKKLNSGYEVPALGYGTWVGLDDEGHFLYEDIPKLKKALKYAIDVGYRHIDTAHLYRVEDAIGEVIEEMVTSEKIRREDLFITTKVWNHMHAFDDVRRSLKDSLKRLRMEYVDLALVHWPMSVTVNGEDAKIDFLETWRGMEAILEAGLVRSIGVSNFNVDQMKRLLANCQVKPAMNQVELNLNLGQKELVDFCQSQDIALTAYTPFGNLLANRNLPDSPEPKVDTPLMVELGKKYNKTPTQIALRHLYQRGLCAIPKSLTMQRIVQNASIFDFALSQEDFVKLSEYDKGYRTVRPVFWQNFENYPFEKVELEKEIPIPETLLRWKNM